MKFISGSYVAGAQRLVPIAASLALALLAAPRADAQPNPYPPTSTDFVVVGTGNGDIGVALAAAVNAAPPGRHILIAPGNYTSGTQTFTATGTSTAPIVIRPDGGTVTITLGGVNNYTWNIHGSRLVIAGLYFNDPRIVLDNGASFNRVTRCQFRQVGGKAILINAATDTRIDHCDISDVISNTTDTKNFVRVDHNSVSAGTCLRVLVDYNYIHDSNPAVGINGSEMIGLVASTGPLPGGAAIKNPQLIIDHNLFSNISIPGDEELIGAKCSGIKFQFNTVLNTGTLCYINAPRQGKDFEFRSNWIESTLTYALPVKLRSDNGLAIGNRFVSGKDLVVAGGAFYWEGVVETGYPAARNWRVIGNRFDSGHVIVGTNGFGDPVDEPALDNNLYGNTRDSGNPAHTLVAGDESGTTFNVDNEPYVPAVKLTAADVGLLAPDPLCDPVLVGHWQLNEGSGTSAADASGKGNNGTLGTAPAGGTGPTWTTGQIGNALTFDGTATSGDDVVNAGSGASLDNLPAISVAAWINPTNMGEGGFGRIVSKAVGPTFGNGWHFLVAGTNQLTFTVDHAAADVVRRSNQNTIATSAWQHVVATWDGTGTAASVKIYVNGSEVTGYDTNTNAGGARAADEGSNLYLGNDSAGSRTFGGKLDDVRVYHGVLSAAQIQAIYQAGLVPAAPTSLAATVAAAPNNINRINLAWVDNASNETGYKIERKKGASGTYAQIGTAAANATAYSDDGNVLANGPGAGTQYYYRVRATNALGDSGYSNEANATTAEVTSGRVAHWKLNETSGTNANDETANNNDGTLTNFSGTYWVAGKINNGLNLDGVNDRVNAGSGSTLDNLAAITLSAWIKPDTLGGGGKGRIVDKTTDTTPLNGWFYDVDDTNQLTFMVDYTTTNLKRSTAVGAITLGAWQHVLVTWTGSATATNIKFYKDGVETAYGTTTNAAGTRVNDGTASVSVGNDSTGVRGFDGVLDDVRIYSRVLIAAEITAIHRAGL